MKPTCIVSSKSSQSGAVLLVAVVLLLLAGVMTLAALNVGVFEQRSTGNDINTKLVNEVAEAGLAQGFEYLMRQNPDMMENDSLWVKCGASETTFPCGAVADDLYDDDADAGTPAVARRSTMFRLKASGHVVSGFSTTMTGRMLSLSDAIPTVGNGRTASYGVAPVLCYVASRLPGESTTSPVRCAGSKDEASSRRVVTFVSVAQLPGESARATLTQTVGRYALLDNPTGKPPIVASGSVDVTGGLQIVTNPNAGGAGVPVSVWTRQDVEKTGTPNTCYVDEFFRFGAQNSKPPVQEGTTITCDTCSCNGDKSLSYDKSGNVQTEGIDILDVEGDSSTPRSGQEGINYNVHSDSLSYPICEFPPDLFAHIFGISAWEDVDKDCFAEVKVMQAFTNPNDGTQVTIGADEAYLYTNALSIINPTTEGEVLQSSDQVTALAYPSAALSGLIWCQSGCDIGAGTQVGTPEHPVVLVIDGSAKIQGRVFGIVYLRTRAQKDGALATLTPSTGYTMTADEITAGGNAVLDMNSGAVVYGAVVIQGQVNKANGTAAIVFDATVLNAIGDNPNNNRYATLPGAWNDNSSY